MTQAPWTKGRSWAWLRHGLMFIMYALVVGCGKNPPPPTSLSLDRFEPETVRNGKEWREARRLPSLNQITLDAGKIESDSTLRIGVLSKRLDATPANVRVYSGPNIVADFSVPANAGWVDREVDLNRPSGEDPRCYITIENAEHISLAPCEIVPKTESHPTNVLIVLIDTLRSDHLGCYGYARNTSPNLDAFANDAIRFTNLVPQSSWTKPSTASLHTSLYPSSHGANNYSRAMRPNVPTLSGALAAAGYETQAFSGNPNVLPSSGFGAGFHRFVDFVPPSDVLFSDHTSYDDLIVDAALSALQHAGDRPWFLYVHAMAPHDPYQPPEAYQDRFKRETYSSDPDQAAIEADIDAYDAEIAFADDEFGRVVRALKDAGQYDNAIILVVSDHGEAFGEHGQRYHGKSLYQEELAVPGLLKLPRNKHGGEVRDALVEHVDWAPTILDLIDAPAEPRFQGRSLVPLIDSNDMPEHFAFASLRLLDLDMVTVRDRSKKLIIDNVADSKRWFDLVQDAQERRPLPDTPDDHEKFVELAQDMRYQGNKGLHLLFISPPDEEHTFTGTIRGAAMGEVLLRYPSNLKDVTQDENGVAFRLDMRDPLEHGGGIWIWVANHTSGARNAALLRMEWTSATPPQIDVQMDGEPLAAELVRIGPEAQSLALEGHPINWVDWTLPEGTIDSRRVPLELRVYGWYLGELVDDFEAIDDPELAEQLRALGYTP